jgi:CDP-diacylglycerol pyrophosphatase
MTRLPHVAQPDVKQAISSKVQRGIDAVQIHIGCLTVE